LDELTAKALLEYSPPGITLFGKVMSMEYCESSCGWSATNSTNPALIQLIDEGADSWAQ
jgi:hypothetical protein